LPLVGENFPQRKVATENRTMTSAEIKEIIESRKTILETLSQVQRRLDAYEYSEENLEFLSNPHQIAMDEQLTSEEVSDIWDDIAGSLQLTPALKSALTIQTQWLRSS